MKKIVFIVLITLVICISLTACKVTDKAEQPAEMQMVYEDNPAFFLKDMKLIWGEKNYYPSNMLNAERGKEIGYATDEYNGWRIYELKGHGRDYLIAVEDGNEDVSRVMSIYPPVKPWRQYILENPTDRQKAERMLSVTLYEDGTARLATPPISSYAMVGTYYYTFKNDELLIFQEKDNPTAVFTVLDNNTIVFKSAMVPLFADVGLRYVRTKNTLFQIKDLPAGELKWEDYDFPFLKPDAKSFEINKRYANPLMCKGITAVERDAYFSRLISDGWNKISDETPYHFIFLKGNEYLSIYLEGAAGSETYVFGYDAGYNGGNRPGATSGSEALKYIRASYTTYQSDPDISVRDAEITAVREVWVKDLFEKTEMQLFQAFGKHGEIAYFLVASKIACILPCGFSVVNHLPIFIEDIDKDGKFEVIASHNVGSGISHFVVSAYKFGNPPEFNSLNKTIYVAYSNSWMEGAPCLTLATAENGNLHLRGFSYDNNDCILSDDYGCLVIDGNKIIPERHDLFKKSFLQGRD